MRKSVREKERTDTAISNNKTILSVFRPKKHSDTSDGGSVKINIPNANAHCACYDSSENAPNEVAPLNILIKALNSKIIVIDVIAAAAVYHISCNLTLHAI